MLVLSRKKGERVIIDKRISVEIVSVDRGKVRLGFVASRDVEIDREEIARSKEQRHGSRSVAS